MNQLPLFVNLSGRNVVLIGEGEAADAKQRLIERAGGVVVRDCPAAICQCAGIAFIALENEALAVSEAQRLSAKGILVNVVDRPALCDFTTPAIIDRDPVLIAVGTGGASAGLAKALRQRLEALLPQSLGLLAAAMAAARSRVHMHFPSAPERRRAIDAAFATGGPLDPLNDHDDHAIDNWLSGAANQFADHIIEINLLSNDPDDLTLRTARLLGEADCIYHDVTITDSILNRARADAVHCLGYPPSPAPTGMVLWLRLPPSES